MGKNLISQKRGKGSPRYRVPNYNFQPNVGYGSKPGKVVDIVNQLTRNPPLAKVKYPDGKIGWMVAPLGLKVGDSTEGLVKALGDMEVGASVFSVETYPNSGPKLCRTSGCSAVVVSKDKGKCIIQLPSKKTKTVSEKCRATLGIPAGEGRGEKPWIKAGKKSHAMHARGKYYPRTGGGKMNALCHPFGGMSSGPGKPKTVSRHASPGRKVGSIAAKRTGRRKK